MNMSNTRQVLHVVLPALFVCLFSTTLQAELPSLSTGDFFVSLSNGTVQWRHIDGTLVQTLSTGNDGQAKGMNFDAYGNLYVMHWYSTDLLTGNDAEVFNRNGIYQGKFGANYNCNPTSIVFDSHGNAFVGQADCDGDILKFDAAGNLLAKFDVATEVRGATWIDLAADGCTMFYTSSGTHIKRFDVCENKQLEDFNAVALTNETHTVSILGDGSVLVAANDGIYRFTPMGTPLTVYDISGGQCWYAMAVDSNTGRLFAGDYCGRSVYIFDLNNGALLQQIDVATEGTHVKGLAVATADILSPPRPPTGRPSNPPEPSTNCRITGGGSVFTAAGVRVTHGMQLRAPATEHPQSLQVNWHVEGQTEMHFHLEGLTSATCVDNPNIDPEMPRTRYDTFIATGTGRLNGDAGATIELVFTDGGEPGGKAGDPVPDTATMLIKDAAGTVVLTVSGPLHFGNHQMH